MEFHGIKLAGQSAVENFRFEPLAADPSGAELFQGRAWENTTENKLKWYNGTAIVEVGSEEKAVELANEVNAIEAAVGLNADGTFKAFTGTNFIDAATSIADASAKLDTALKAQGEAQALVNTAVSTELGAVETAVGLNEDGTLVPFAGTNFIDAATSIAAAAGLLDTAVKANADAIVAGVAEAKTHAETKATEALGASKVYTDNLIQGLRWIAPVKKIVAHHTDEEATAAEGDRFICSTDGKIYTKTADGWTDVTPRANDTAINSEDDRAYTYDLETTTWVQSSGGANLIVAGVGLEREGNSIKAIGAAGIVADVNGLHVDVQANSGLFLTVDGTTASTDAAAKLAVKVGEGLEAGANGVAVAAKAIAAKFLGADVAGAGLQGGDGAALAVKVADGETLLSAAAGGIAFDKAALITETDGKYVAKGQTATVFESLTPALEHTIKHDLARRLVNVTVYNAAEEVIIPAKIVPVDENNVKVVLAVAAAVSVVIG